MPCVSFESFVETQAMADSHTHTSFMLAGLQVHRHSTTARVKPGAVEYEQAAKGPHRELGEW